jgi:hypothetical protein
MPGSSYLILITTRSSPSSFGELLERELNVQQKHRKYAAPVICEYLCCMWIKKTVQPSMCTPLSHVRRRRRHNTTADLFPHGAIEGISSQTVSTPCPRASLVARPKSPNQTSALPSHPRSIIGESNSWNHEFTSYSASWLLRRLSSAAIHLFPLLANIKPQNLGFERSLSRIGHRAHRVFYSYFDI